MMNNKLHFYDPLYDFVTFEEAEKGEYRPLKIFQPGFGTYGDAIHTKGKSKQILPFLDTFELNRLNFLRQSGLAFLVYPSSSHTRFAHSIGSCYLGFIACEKITMQAEKYDEKKRNHCIESRYLANWLDKKYWREEFLLALLLHDIGHFPFSHIFESNREFWDCFPEKDRVSHEDLTCELIIGKGKGFESFKKYINFKFESQKTKQLDYKFVSNLIEKGRQKSINTNILCYLISGKEKYLKNITKKDRLELTLVHELVSGFLDLDRIDHYRRDSYFSGLKYGSNLNFSGLLGGMTLYYYPKDIVEEDIQFELRFSNNAIGHALTLLHAKERLVQDCFENPINIAYEAMLHKSINIYMGIEETESQQFSDSQIQKAYDLFFLTDDELLHKLMQEGSERVKELIFRIRYRKPYTFVKKSIINPKRYSLREIRENLIKRTKFSSDDIILKTGRFYGSKKIATKEWLDLHYLYDENGVNLDKIDDYKKQIDYFKSVQDQDKNVVWFLVSEAKYKEQLEEALTKAIPYAKI